MGHGALPSNNYLKKQSYYLNLVVIRDEARATAASSALSRILQGAVKLLSKTRQATDGDRQNNLQAAGDVDEFQVNLKQEMLDVQRAGDVKVDGKGWQEDGTSMTRPYISRKPIQSNFCHPGFLLCKICAHVCRSM